MKTFCIAIDQLFSIGKTTTRLTAAARLGVGVFMLLASGAQAADCCPSSWVFKRSTFTHAPETGARVAQYQRHAPVEELPDPRLVTSGYRRTRTNLRGADGSIDSTYQVQNWGNGRGGLDAESERVYDAWRQSSLLGGFFLGGGYGPGFGGPGFGGPGFGGPGFGGPGFGGPGFGGPGFGGPGFGGPGFGGPGFGFPGGGGYGYGYPPAYGYHPTWYPRPAHYQGHGGHGGHQGRKVRQGNDEHPHPGNKFE